MQYEGGMTLGEVIERLKKVDHPSQVVALGFGGSCSYRGYYECLALIPEAGVTIARMLSEAEAAVGKTFHGWKGGDYTMRLDTECYLAKCGDCGVPMTDRLLGILLDTLDF
jgi:hypothetical protein